MTTYVKCQNKPLTAHPENKEYIRPVPVCGICHETERSPKHVPAGNFDGGHDFRRWTDKE